MRDLTVQPMSESDAARRLLLQHVGIPMSSIQSNIIGPLEPQAAISWILDREVYSHRPARGISSSEHRVPLMN